MEEITSSSSYKWPIWQLEDCASPDFTLADDENTTMCLFLRRTLLRDHKCSNCKNQTWNLPGISSVLGVPYMSLYFRIKPPYDPALSSLLRYNQFMLKLSILDNQNKKLYTMSRICSINPTENNCYIYGFCDFIRLSQFKSYLCLKPIYIVCKVKKISTDKIKPFNLEVEENYFTSQFTPLLNQNTLSDVTLNVEGKQIRAHKVILYAKCPYFEKMFSHNTIENSTNKVDVNFKYEPFFEVLRYMYTGRLEKLETFCEAFYKIAQYYQIDSLKYICEQFFINNLKESNNLLEILKLAQDFEATDLKKCCIRYFIESGSLNEDLLAYITSHPSLAGELISQQQAALKKYKGASKSSAESSS